MLSDALKALQVETHMFARSHIVKKHYYVIKGIIRLLATKRCNQMPEKLTQTFMK